MTLKEELEILRGEPIQVFTGDPMDIPCIETSDSEKLCKHPVVSVYMITYNHEPYMRQAIEGVMMQQTDFEFELVIGEDASTDRTREICFEYQQKFPEKIRVLWWYENLYQNPHPAGGNSRRTMARCRGNFIALCEGDDYWIDPLKLQKQVDVMRKHANVGFCFCGSRRYYQNEDRYDIWNEGYITYRPGMQRRDWFFTTFMLGEGKTHKGSSCAGFIMTATTMIRKNLLERIYELYEVFSWRMRLGDATLWLGASSLMDGYYIPDIVSVYRIATTGVFQNPRSRVGVQIDGHLVRMYFFVKVFNLPLVKYPRMAMLYLAGLIRANRNAEYKQYARNILMAPKSVIESMAPWYAKPYWYIAAVGFLNRYTNAMVWRLWYYVARRLNWTKEVVGVYENL